MPPKPYAAQASLTSVYVKPKQVANFLSMTTLYAVNVSDSFYRWFYPGKPIFVLMHYPLRNTYMYTTDGNTDAGTGDEAFHSQIFRSLY